MKKMFLLFSLSMSMVVLFNLNIGYQKLTQIKLSYPDTIQTVNLIQLTWINGSSTSVFKSSIHSPSLWHQANQQNYLANKEVECDKFIPTTDPGRIRNETFFNSMYGSTEQEVSKNMTTLYWMPKFFGHQFPLLVSTVNHVDQKLKHVSNELEILMKQHPDFIKYVKKPSTFEWRTIENSHRISPHSYGIAIDLYSPYSNYWLWDTQAQQNNLNQYDEIKYQNHMPCEIVSIFEKNGFIWGGKWRHYDTMHFEYRPELLAR
jgi:peptidoglycan LD-endopeptidase CwlK